MPSTAGVTSGATSSTSAPAATRAGSGAGRRCRRRRRPRGGRRDPGPRGRALVAGHARPLPVTGRNDGGRTSGRAGPAWTGDTLARTGQLLLGRRPPAAPVGLVRGCPPRRPVTGQCIPDPSGVSRGRTAPIITARGARRAAARAASHRPTVSPRHVTWTNGPLVGTYPTVVPLVRKARPRDDRGPAGARRATAPGDPAGWVCRNEACTPPSTKPSGSPPRQPQAGAVAGPRGHRAAVELVPGHPRARREQRRGGERDGVAVAQGEPPGHGGAGRAARRTSGSPSSSSQR